MTDHSKLRERMKMWGLDHVEIGAGSDEEIYAEAFEAGFGFCNYAHNLGNPPETESERDEIMRQEADRETYKRALTALERLPRLPLKYPFTLHGLGIIHKP